MQCRQPLGGEKGDKVETKLYLLIGNVIGIFEGLGALLVFVSLLKRWKATLGCGAALFVAAICIQIGHLLRHTVGSLQAISVVAGIAIVMSGMLVAVERHNRRQNLRLWTSAAIGALAPIIATAVLLHFD
jgi:uncharacterized membrane protein HdeD (DUF308 family)